MFCSKKITNKINAAHKRSLWIILNYYESLYSLLLPHQATFHQRCINSLMIEVYRYLNGHYLTLWMIFSNLEKICTISQTSTSSRQKTLVHWNTDSMLLHVASQLWQQVPIDIREAASLALFKNRITFRNVKIVYVDLAKDLFRMSGISD